MATSGNDFKKQKTDRTIQKALLMKYMKMSSEEVDELNETQWESMVSAANEIEQKTKDIEQKKTDVEQRKKVIEQQDARPSVDFHSACNWHSPTASTAKHGSATPFQQEPKEELQEVDENDEVLHCPSRLLQDLIDNDALRNDGQKLTVFYATKADVSSYVSAALKDALTLVNASTGTRLMLHHEVSLWSTQPDHLVVWNHASNTPIIAVEVQKPMEETIDGSLPPEPVIGQIFDYLMELRCFGQAAPFVILSTLTSSWMFWENDEETSRLVLAENNLDEWKERTRSLSQKTGSPSELMQAKFATTNSDFSTFNSRDFDRNETIMQSVKFDFSQIVQLFYTGIICSLLRNFDTAPLEQQNRTRWNGLALHLTENEYEWGQLDLKVGESVQLATKCPPHKKTAVAGSFFAVGLLGYGQTSKVFDAYDHLGQRCAVKMYVDHFQEEFEESRLEVERLKCFYPELADKFSLQTLNHFPCIIMPIFHPLTKNEKQECIEKIRTCLARFVDKNGILWKYRDEDLHWGHVGVYEDEHGDREIIMYGLADLVELETLEENVFESREPHVDMLMDLLNE